MNLETVLESGLPLVWYVTEEPSKTISNILNLSESTNYRMDPLEGVLKVASSDTWSGEVEWLPVLFEPDNDLNRVIENESQALGYFFQQEEGGLLLLYGGLLKPLTEVGVQLNYLLREAWNKEDNTKHQVVFISSYKDEIPPILEREILRVEEPLPDAEHLSSIAERANLPDAEAYGQAALGMTDFETHLTINELRQAHNISVSELHRRKAERLKQNANIDLRRPKLSLDDLGGMDKMKEIVRQVEWTWNNPGLVDEYGITPIRRMLLMGISGVGKSLACECVASSLGIDLAKGGISQSMSKWVGESERNMREMFKTLERIAPVVFWVDEFGRDAASGSNDGGTTERTHGEFLTGIQELPENIFFAAAANRIEGMPPEMTRADRFDVILFAGFPTIHERVEIFKIHLGDRAEEHDLHKLAEATPYFTGAEIKQLIKRTTFDIAYQEKRFPHTNEIIERVPQIKSRVWVNHRDSVISMYEHAMKEWEWASSGQEKLAEKVMRDAHKVTPQYVPNQRTAGRGGMRFGASST